MNPLIFLLTCALGGIAGLALLNRFWFPRLSQQATDDLCMTRWFHGAIARQRRQDPLMT